MYIAEKVEPCCLNKTEFSAEKVKHIFSGTKFPYITSIWNILL